MHPEIAKSLVEQHRDELVRDSEIRPPRRPPQVPAVARQLDQDRAGPGRRAGLGGREPRRPSWPARFVPRDHHLGPPLGLTSPPAGPSGLRPWCRP